ncbi:hypothetical protein BKA81DRAFT_363943 [Phyllosticta paracitricarpa]|uniref:Uncharacterized protein n=1 Tax=Phyllosticta paracitricarpa TaxID=2016321 RepID=A0ABR1MXQ8_9PEZI
MGSSQHPGVVMNSGQKQGHLIPLFWSVITSGPPKPVKDHQAYKNRVVKRERAHSVGGFFDIYANSMRHMQKPSEFAIFEMDWDVPEVDDERLEDLNDLSPDAVEVPEQAIEVAAEPDASQIAARGRSLLIEESDRLEAKYSTQTLSADQLGEILDAASHIMESIGKTITRAERYAWERELHGIRTDPSMPIHLPNLLRWRMRAHDRLKHCAGWGAAESQRRRHFDNLMFASSRTWPVYKHWFPSASACFVRAWLALVYNGATGLTVDSSLSDLWNELFALIQDIGASGLEDDAVGQALENPVEIYHNLVYENIKLGERLYRGAIVSFDGAWWMDNNVFALEHKVFLALRGAQGLVSSH